MMTPEQEMRAKALELKVTYLSHIGAAAVTANRVFTPGDWWHDGELDRFYNYIRSGVKPKQ